MIVQRNPRLAWRLVHDRPIVITTDDATLHELNASGGFLFEQLAGGPRSVSVLASGLSAAFGVSREHALADTHAFVADMLSRGVLLPVKTTETSDMGSLHSAPRISATIERLTRRDHILHSALLEVTGACNLRCGHCYRNGGNIGKDLSRREISGLLHELADMGCLYLILTGGEILERADFFSIAREARELGFALSLFTNGTLIDRRTARRIADLAVMDLGISLYGPTADVHERFTGMRGSFDRSVRGLRMLADLGVRTSIKCLVTRDNIAAYASMLALARSLGARCEFDATITATFGGDTRLLKLRPSARQLRGFLADPRVRRVDPAPPRRASRSVDKEVPCDAGVTSCTILADGTVLPCLQLHTRAGSIRERSLRQIWEHAEVFARLRGIRNHHLTACMRCDLRPLCDRCPGLALSEDGDLLGPSTVACETARVHRAAAARHRR